MNASLFIWIKFNYIFFNFIYFIVMGSRKNVLGLIEIKAVGY